MLKIAHHSDGSQRKVNLGGWQKQTADIRDDAYRLKIHGSFLSIPQSVDLRSICSPIDDQGSLGSCTANMFAGMIESNEIKAGRGFGDAFGGMQSSIIASSKVETSNVVLEPSGVITFVTTIIPSVTSNTKSDSLPKLIDVSRLFEYYATRKIEGTINKDAGASIRDTIKAGYTYGVVDETAWPYDISKFTVNPPSELWTSAVGHRVTSYHGIADGDIQTMKSTIASGYLVGYGFRVYDYFMSSDMSKKGFLHVPGPNEKDHGGHAQCLCGYDDNKVNPFDETKKGAFLVRNSWGAGWGLSGYYWVSYDYIANTDLSADFWVIQSSPV